MINMYCNNNRVIGSVCATHGAQATIHAVHHAMQHMPHDHQYSVVQHQIIHHYPHAGYTHQSIYPMGFTPISFY
ncbi:hypothetical protein A9485_25630 [Bacillus cereus]|uniref:hypothetical protein n=1 Tax=Bacillus cereus TaxID=1396 RepID=UPI0008FDD903|nr:hypothetical protein [Bacillus cereus]OJD98589.1 hypothetical protein A9485_25630 [Bacillus cereus]